MAGNLTGKQRAFVEAYLSNGMNATQAAKDAGYRAKNNASFGAIGAENLRKLKIKQQVDKRLKEMAMSADEVLYHLSQQAEGVDTTQFIDLEKIYSPDKEGDLVLVGSSLIIDIEKIRELGLGKMIKKISQTTSGISIEWYDRQRALELMGRYHKLFKDQNFNLDIDLSKLTNEQLERIANGDDPLEVLANQGES